MRAEPVNKHARDQYDELIIEIVSLCWLSWKSECGKGERLTPAPNHWQLHHRCSPRVQQALEFRREECRLGEYTRGVHLVVGVLFDVGELLGDCDCVGEEGFAVEVFGADN